MRAKELKKFLNNLPDDTEILIRCQLHEKTPITVKETIGIASVTPHLNDTVHEIMFNAERNIRLSAFQPNPTDLVSCMTCTKGSRIQTCQKRGRMCETCRVVCDCKDCGHFNIEMEEPFTVRPKYELDPIKKRMVEKNKLNADKNNQ